MIISVRVKLGSCKEKIIRIDVLHYIVHVKELAREGKANLVLLKVLKKYFKADHNVRLKFLTNLFKSCRIYSERIASFPI